MKRRTMIAGLLALPLAAHAATPPYRVSLLGGGFDGAAWQAGVLIELDKGWKTYWRMPGEAGIPPQFDWSKSTGAAAIDVLYPLPGRFHDASGETVGYENRVVFPVVVKGKGAVELRLSLFFAVCKDICIPAKAAASLKLPPAENDQGLIDPFMKLVPGQGVIAGSAAAVSENGKTVLVLALTRRVDDIFVESTSTAYFRAPEFSSDGLEARLVADNVKDPTQLKGQLLKLTAAVDGGGLEQSVTVD